MKPRASVADRLEPPAIGQTHPDVLNCAAPMSKASLSGTSTGAGSALPTQSGRESIGRYIRAKDENRPWLMAGAFAPAANLEMIVKPDSISFPPLTEGLEAITNVLVRRFAQNYENVRTLCFGPGPGREELSFSCDWLVGMSGKQDRRVRVGCGRYDWTFLAETPRLVDRLVITVEEMQSLEPGELKSIADWLDRLAYPWSDAALALAAAPAIDELQPIRRYLARGPD